MGYYIDKNSANTPLGALGKAQALIADGARQISPPTTFQENLVCVVDNRIFEAAAYCYSPEEMEEFLRPDGRRKVWLVYEHAAKLSGY